VNREQIFDVIEEFGIPLKRINFTKAVPKHVKYLATIQDDLSE
jgi:hypothetical protein